MVMKFYSCVVSGFRMKEVLVEVDLSNQIPAFVLVGMASSMTQESRERVRAGITNSGFEWPGRKITANLVPADLPKWGSHFELPMAMGIVLAEKSQDDARKECLGSFPRILAFGQISLSGEIHGCGFGALVAHWMRNEALPYDAVICAEADALELRRELAGGDGNHARILGVADLGAAVKAAEAARQQPRRSIAGPALGSVAGDAPSRADYSSLAGVEGEPMAVMAGLAALADPSLHLLLSGPQGMGKSMVASAIVDARGALSGDERIALRLVRQALGGESGDERRRPAVFLQSTVSRAALEGSVLANGQAFPGEVSRAHGGILVMDEFLEFRRDVLESLRQPMEEGIIRLQRARLRAELPACFQLIATTNLCPCGAWMGRRGRVCRCTDAALLGYQRRLSGPLMDRFPLMVTLGVGAPSAAPPKAFGKPDKWESMVAGARDLLRHAAPAGGIGILLPPGDHSRRGAGSLYRVAAAVAALQGRRAATAADVELAYALRCPPALFNKNSVPMRR